MSKEIYNTCKKPYVGKCENVSVISATDIYEESEFVSGKIWELIREKGYKFSDIAHARTLKIVLPFLRVRLTDMRYHIFQTAVTVFLHHLW